MREGIQPPKFADKFSHLDFQSSPMPVINLYPMPSLPALKDLQLEICGLEQPLRTVTGSQLQTLETVKLKAPLICQIFNWTETVEWEGVRLADFLNYFQVETHPEGYYAIYSGDGVYFETLSADEVRDPRILLAYALNGAPLPSQHGGPMRLVVPFLQGYKSVKWVSSIRAFRNDPMGIKRLLGQSASGQLNEAWRERFQIVLPPGRAGDPPPLSLSVSVSSPASLPTGDVARVVPEEPVHGMEATLFGFVCAPGISVAASRETAGYGDNTTGGEEIGGMRQIMAFLRPGRHQVTRQALEAAGIVSYTKFSVLGRGRQRGLRFPSSDGGEAAVQFLPKQCFSILVEESQVPVAVEAIQKVNRTGKGEHGDGKIFVFDVVEAVRISTDERGLGAI